MARKKQPSFEEAIAELETLVEQLESGELTLDESLQTFEKGIALTRVTQQALETAEQKVRILSEPLSEDSEPEDFTHDE
ncbi:MAG TPA: exodeoxyribonuclease VII small subunit [Chromatiaceae bacterium]|nr:exodeoxyribonuclease VII small subunit [Chromatiaceae bacterium]